VRWFGSRQGWISVAALALATASCSASAPSAPKSACGASPCRKVAPELVGLRVSVSEVATTICVNEGGCLGLPQGSIRTAPLQPPIRRALSEALTAVGFQVVAGDAERDMAAGVEWRGTDTIALLLRDVNGRLLDSSSYKRSLEPCRALADLTWDSCWAANFEPMRLALTSPLERSSALFALARKKKGGSTEPTRTEVATLTELPTEANGVVGDRLNDQQLQETVARYREQLQRSCWQPALDAREPTAPTSARVSTSVTVAASGSVLDIKTGGDPLGYPRLADCIAGQVRSWRFPAAKGASTATIPFVFAGE
jgi:hypothetical protein